MGEEPKQELCQRQPSDASGIPKTAEMSIVDVECVNESKVQQKAPFDYVQQLDSTPQETGRRTGRSVICGSKAESVAASHRSRGLGHSLWQLKSKLPFVGGTQEKQRVKHPGMYSIRQFQNNLAHAILKRDPDRFEKLLGKYNTCCVNNRIVDFAADSEPFVLSVSLERNAVEENTVRRGSLSLTGRSGVEKGLRNDDVLRSLIDRVVDFTTGHTLTHLAVASGNPRFVKSCLNFGTAVHTHEDLNGDTALSLALWAQPEMVFMMLEQGLDVNIARLNMRDRNLLHHAVCLSAETPPWPDRIDFIKRLLACESKIASAKDIFGFTPEMLAMEHADYFCKEELVEVISILRDAEAREEARLRIKAKKKKPQGKEGGVELVDDRAMKSKKKPLEMTPSGIMVVHSETLPSDRLRLVMEGPATRLACILLLLFLHIIAYATDVADRGREAQYRDAEWALWFTMWNNIGSCWNGSAFLMGLAHFFCSFGAAIVGALVCRLVMLLLLGRIMRLPIFGSQGDAEKQLIQASFGRAYLALHKGSDRGRCFAFFLGAGLGVYGGAHAYNALLYRFWPGQVSWALIQPTLAGVDAVTALRNFWVTALVMDWYLFMFVLDIMYQQGSLNVYLPHHTFGWFAATINNMLRWGKKEIAKNELFTVHMILYWSSLLFGWGLIAAVFIFVEISYAPAREFFVEPLVSVSWVGVPVVLGSICIFLECVIACQEWTWPTFQVHPFLHFPGLVIGTNHAWFLMLILILQSTLDIRFISVHLELLMHQTDEVGVKAFFLYAVLLAPAVIGSVLLLSVIIRSSLWWEMCGKHLSFLPLYSEHMRCNPCPLQNEGAAMLAKSVTAHEEFKLPRSLAFKAGVKGCKQNIKIRNAMKNTSRQMFVASLDEDASQTGKAKVGYLNLRNLRRQGRSETRNSSFVDAARGSNSSPRRFSLGFIRGALKGDGGGSCSSLSLISLNGSKEELPTPSP